MGNLLEMYGEANEPGMVAKKPPKIVSPIKRGPRIIITSGNKVTNSMVILGNELLSYFLSSKSIQSPGFLIPMSIRGFTVQPFYAILIHFGYTPEFLRKRPIYHAAVDQDSKGKMVTNLLPGHHPRHCNMLFPMFMFGKHILCLLFWM